MLKNLLIIGTGGFLGSVARYLVSQLNLTVSFHSIPVGTLIVNVTGSFIIGFLTGIAEKSMILTPEWRLFLMVGLCGGFEPGHSSRHGGRVLRPGAGAGNEDD